jgi:hypothetical protein
MSEGFGPLRRAEERINEGATPVPDNRRRHAGANTLRFSAIARLPSWRDVPGFPAAGFSTLTRDEPGGQNNFPCEALVET